MAACFSVTVTARSAALQVPEVTTVLTGRESTVDPAPHRDLHRRLHSLGFRPSGETASV